MIKFLLFIVSLAFLSHGAFARAWSSKDQAIGISVGGCATGMAVGFYLDSQDNSDDKSSMGTVLGNTGIGCLMGLAYSYFFVDDDQQMLVRQQDKLKFELDQANKVIRKNNYQRMGVPSSVSSKVSESGSQSHDFGGFKDKRCKYVQFKLMNNGKDFVPVSKNIIIPNVFYYSASRKIQNCVKPDGRYGLLQDVIPGLVPVLNNAAEEAASNMIRSGQ